MANSQSDQILIHFYRAIVQHMDVWRQRMDATTNWAAATMAGMITFVFGSLTSPHFVVLLAVAFDTVFLIMESRRYQMFDLWRRRFRTLNHYFIAPALLNDGVAQSEEGTAQLRNLAQSLGDTVPAVSLLQAVGYRTRRNHGYVLLVGLIAWTLKLEAHPEPASGLHELIDRARIANVPGIGVTAIVGVYAVAMLLLALRAPSEQMLEWTEIASPIRRFWHFGRD